MPKISRNTINKLLGKTRIMIFVVSQKAEKDYREFALAESYFRAKRIKGKRAGKVYVEIVKNCTREQLMPLITR